MHTLKEKALTGTSLANARFDTIRLKLLKIGAQVRELKKQSCMLSCRLYSSERYICNDGSKYCAHNLTCAYETNILFFCNIQGGCFAFLRPKLPVSK